MRHLWLRATDDSHFNPDLPPVHVAADHEVGRAVPEVDTGKVTKCIAKLREAALCFQAIHQDLRGKERTGYQSRKSGRHRTPPLSEHFTDLRKALLLNGLDTSRPLKLEGHSYPSDKRPRGKPRVPWLKHKQKHETETQNGGWVRQPAFLTQLN